MHAPHLHVPHPKDHAAWNTRLADKVAGVFGSMSMFWVLVLWQLIWMALATLGIWVFKSDVYPFAFLLFLSNLIQLWALPILGAATNRADEKRAVKADADHQALTHIANTVDQVLTVVTVLAGQSVVPEQPTST